MTTPVRGMANMRIADQPNGSDSAFVAPRVAYGQQVTVQHMTEEQDRDLQMKINRVCIAEQNLAAARKKIADADTEIAAASADMAKAQARMAACDARIIQGLDTFAASLQKRKEGQDPQTVARIEALRQKVLAAKTNLPSTAAAGKQMVLQLQKEAQELYQSLKKA